MSCATQVPSRSLIPFSPTGLSPAAVCLSRAFRLTLQLPSLTVLQPRMMRCHTCGLGSSAFARHYLRNHFCFLFLRVLRCFSSPGSPPANWPDTLIIQGGLPHSDIRASTGICPYTRLFAACHVLLRLREPRHPSCALLLLSFYLLKLICMSCDIQSLWLLVCFSLFFFDGIYLL